MPKLSNGLEISEEVVPLSHKECEIGKSIYENGQLMYHLKSSHSLAKDHEEFHNIYKKLYIFMGSKQEGNFFNKRRLEKQNRKLMDNYAITLKTLSDNILKSLNNIQREVTETPEDRINSWFNN